MKRVYIDFDSTLYDTEVVKKNLNDIIADGVIENVSDCDKNVVIEEIKQAKASGVKSVIGLCKFFESKYSLEKDCIKKRFQNFLAKGEELLYSDSIDFLKRLSQKGYEVNILTYTSREDFEYQMLKVMGAKISDYVDNIIMCSKSKGELGLDYQKEVVFEGEPEHCFVDDNPRELVSLFNAGVSPDRLFRIKRNGASYSDVTISEFEAKEYANFEDIEI